MILGIDTSSEYAVVALCDNSIILGEFTIKAVRTHSDILLPMIEQLFLMANVKKTDLTYVAIANGPGSFTGLKIGASVGKAIAKALEIPIIPVPTLGSLAYNINTDSLICPLQDARRNEVYSALYKKVNDTLSVVLESMVISMEDLIKTLVSLNKPITFVGDYKNYIDVIEQSTICHTFASPNDNFPQGSSLCLYAQTIKKEAVSSDFYRPNYIRKPQAERDLENKA